MRSLKNCSLIINNKPILISGSKDKTIIAWDLNNKDPIPLFQLKNHNNWIMSVTTIEVDNKLLLVSGSYDRSIIIYN